MLNRRGVLTALGAASVAPSAWARPTTAYSDLMPDYFRVMDAAAELTPMGRAQALMDRFVAPHAALYERAGVRKLTVAKIAKATERTAPLLGRMRALHRAFPALFAENQRQFAKAFPSFSPTASPVYLMPSFLRFDGHLEPDGKVLPLYLGLDGAVFFHEASGDLGVLLAHELFHCEHAQASPEIMLDPQAPLWKPLWSEGLATYVSEKMHPEASRKHVLLDAEDLERRGDAFVKPWAQGLLAKMGSTADEDSAAFFSAGHEGPDPARGGYLVGLLIARRLGESRSLNELAALTPEQAEPLVRAELERLAG